VNKKIISSLVLPIFFLFSISCVIHKTSKEKIDSIDEWEGKEFELKGILKTSGEKIEYSKGVKAKIVKGNIVAYAIKKRNLAIDRSDIEDIEERLGEIVRITTRDGSSYAVSSSKTEGNKLIIDGYEAPPPIPLSEVELLWVSRTDAGMTFVATIGGIAGTIGIIAVIVALTKESCPFIYAFDGDIYTFDAEPYGGAICQGLKRTEWCGLEHLEEVNGQFRIKITNEIHETQYTDELKIVVVDHEKNVQIAPDIFGRIHSISEPLLPILAYDGNGKDLMPYIRENDWIYWKTRVETKKPERDEDLREDLTFIFPKPENASKVKFLFNGCNTLWGSQMLKRYLDLHGNKVQELYEDIDCFGPAFFRIMNWDLNEELYRLRIRVETDEGWKSKGMIFGGGPFISEDKVYPFDISDVSGNLLKIKLTPPSAFWMINHLAVDYSENGPIEMEEIQAAKAIDHNGQDIREKLAQNDNLYYIMPHIGDWAELVFLAPPKVSDLDRSYLLKASGYYDIHLDATGKPQTEIIEKCFDEPGYAVRFALKEYYKWKSELEKMN
jgi:hypothetical protein